jgi:uncharacterized repeat protein (TIGR03943 family)
VNKETQSIVTGLLGGLLLSITLSGRYTSYVKPGFRPMLLIAGVVLMVVAALSLVIAIRVDLRRERAAREAGRSGNREHEHEHDGAGTALDEDADVHDNHRHSAHAPWLILAPVLVLLFVAPPALGADSLSRGLSCGTPAPDGAAYPSRRVAPDEPLPATGPVRLTMQEFISRSLYDSAYSTVNTDIEVTAFIARSQCDGPGYSLARLRISCCAADANALRVHVDGPAPYPPDTWVIAVIRAVKGTGDESNNYVPSATVVSIRKVGQPADPYET